MAVAYGRAFKRPPAHPNKCREHFSQVGELVVVSLPCCAKTQTGRHKWGQVSHDRHQRAKCHVVMWSWVAHNHASNGRTTFPRRPTRRHKWPSEQITIGRIITLTTKHKQVVVYRVYCHHLQIMVSKNSIEINK